MPSSAQTITLHLHQPTREASPRREEYHHGAFRWCNDASTSVWLVWELPRDAMPIKGCFENALETVAQADSNVPIFSENVGEWEKPWSCVSWAVFSRFSNAPTIRVHTQHSFWRSNAVCCSRFTSSSAEIHPKTPKKTVYAIFKLFLSFLLR